MAYILGKNSMKELIGVHPILSFAVVEAIKITKQDFMVFDGVRTTEEQRKLVARKVSKTMRSYHLYGLAVDLVAYIYGRPSWDAKYYKEIEVAMKEVIHKHNLPIDYGKDMWGWDLPHYQITKFADKDARDIYDIRKL